MVETRSLSGDAPGSVYAPRYIPGQGLVSAQTGEKIVYSDAPGYGDGVNDAADSNYTPPTAPGAQGTVDPALPTAPALPGATQGAQAPVPSPYGANTLPQGALPYDQALANVPKGPNQAAIQGNLANAYGKAHQDLKAGGPPNPMGGTYGAVKGAVANNTSQPEQPSNPLVDQTYATNPYLKKVNDENMEFLSPEATNKSLQGFLDIYAADRAALQGINVEMMNNKRLMAGNGDMIRDEITKAGGFATEGQVEAMTFARNKHLVYANSVLTDQAATAQDAIQTDMQMYGMAKDEANTQFNQRMAIANYKQENVKFMYTAAQDQIKNNINYMGGVDNYYASLQGNPQQLSYTESLLGMAPGSLAIAAKTASKERAQEQKKADLQNKVLESNLKTDAMQRSNIQSQINERGKPDPSLAPQGVVPGQAPKGKPDPMAAEYAARAVAAGAVITDTSKNATSMFSAVNTRIPNGLKTSTTQKIEQAQKNFVTAVLRPESGASISDSEFATAREVYFPKIGDNDATVMQKAQSRADAINGVIGKAGTAYNGTYVESPYTQELSVPAPNGQTYTFPDKASADKFRKEINAK